MKVRFYMSLLILVAGSFVLGASCAPVRIAPIYPQCGETNKPASPYRAHPFRDAPPVLTLIPPDGTVVTQ